MQTKMVLFLWNDNYQGKNLVNKEVIITLEEPA